MTKSSIGNAEQVILEWKSNHMLGASQIASPVGGLVGVVQTELALGERPLTLTSGCKHSWDTQVSCGHFCTLTKECSCSSFE